MRPGPEDWQETEESALFLLSPQTHVSLVLFFRLQDPELVFFFFFFPLPYLPACKAKHLGKEAELQGWGILVHIGEIASGKLSLPFDR